MTTNVGGRGFNPCEQLSAFTANNYVNPVSGLLSSRGFSGYSGLLPPLLLKY